MPNAAADCSPGPTASDCDLQNRVAAADAYLIGRPGSTGYVLRDRKTGATYRNSHAGELVWTASTISWPWSSTCSLASVPVRWH